MLPPSENRHAELVSASIAPSGETVWEERWTLKQVQGDGSDVQNSVSTIIFI
jgi:hypothetical protein